MLQPVQYPNGYFQQLVHTISMTASLLPFATIALGFLVRQGILDHRFYAGDLLFGLISLGLILVAVCNIYLLKIDRRASPGSYLFLAVAYHALAICFLLFVSGMNTPFLVGWIFLIIATDTYFGVRATFLSLSVLVLTTLAWFGLYPSLTLAEHISTLTLGLSVTAVGLMLSRLRSTTDRERIDLERTRTQANFQRERLMALINSMGDAVIATNDTGKIRVYNAATLSLLDTNADLTNKDINSVVKFRNQKGKRVNLIDQAESKGQGMSRDDITRTFDDNEHQHLYVNISPVRPGYRTEGERGYIFVLRDITKQKSLDQERDEFVSVVSHELRTPIAITEGNLSNLKLMQQKGASAATFTQALNESHEQIMYLAKLVNDLGTLSRAERGVGAEAEQLSLTTLLTEIYTEYEPQAAAKKLRLDIDLAPNLPAITTSRLYLQEVLQNLITNAIKYTQTGSVTLSAKVRQNSVVVAVKDTGIGISKADQAHIFEKFYRSEDYRTRETSGTGLGLYVCKKLAEKLGYALTFTSRLNHGSTFELVIALQPEQTTPQRAGSQ